jgi:polyisoprenyl-phosphate glycosyltransferase
MDSDGQDRPIDIALLLASSCRHPRHVVLARRAKRSESYAFRACYGVYRLLFYALTGQPISFGNFCVIPIAAVRRLAHMPELWNNLAASIMRSRLSYTMVPTTRGGRLAGRSQMNLVSLILHGLTAMSVYTTPFSSAFCSSPPLLPPRRVSASPPSSVSGPRPTSRSRVGRLSPQATY